MKIRTNVAGYYLTLAALTVASAIGGCGDASTNAKGRPSHTPRSTPTATVAQRPSTTQSATTPSPTGAPTDTSTPTATSTPTPVTTPIVSNPLVEGPITTPAVPFVQSTTFDLGSVGYEQQEFFISGTAISYANDGELGGDGVWKVVPADSAPFKTRILVYRPIDAETFNGTVVVEWLNVSGGLDAAVDWTGMHTELIRQGYVWVGVSAQFVGVEGSTRNPIPGLRDLSLKGFRPNRYGSLSHPGDSFSYDMFSQVGQAIRHPVGINPLEGLSVERVIAVGESQSAFRMVTYINAIHPLVHVFDGFLVHSRGSLSAPLSQAPQADIPVPGVTFIRTDLDVPVLTFETETDLIGLRFLPSRQDDGPLFRLWEVAGTSHADTYTLMVGWGDVGNNPSVADVVSISAPVPGIIECDSPVNSGPQHWVLKAAMAALDRWVRGGDAPPMAPRMETAGDPAAFVLDELGNVRGGIRTPYVDVPIAVLSGLGQSGQGFCEIFGTTVFFDQSTVASLYPTHAAYVAAVNASTDSAVAAGFILEPDGELIKAAAVQSPIGG